LLNNPIVLLSNVTNIQVLFTAVDSPIWRARLWITYEKNLSFMAKTDPYYNKYVVTIQNIMIDFIEYLRVDNYNALRLLPASWMLDPNDNAKIFIHFKNHNPPFRFISFKSGLLVGFSYKESVMLGSLKTFPLLLDIPDIEEQSDIFAYQRMSFSTGNIVIDNSSGFFDNLFELFGNDINLMVLTEENKLQIIKQYYIEKYNIGLRRITFSIKDKRAKLEFKVPNTFYNRTEYPFIEEKLIDKVQQDAYGYCVGVKGTCVNRHQVYKSPTYTPNSGFNDYFQFKFARNIKSIEKVYVKKSGVWIEVFPGLGIEGNTDTSNGADYVYKKKNPNPIQVVIKDEFGNDNLIDITDKDFNKNDGRIAIWWSQALKDNPGHLQRRNGNAEEVKMTGVFVDLHTPGDIVKDLMTHYGDTPYEDYYFNMQEWEKEMKNMKPIGICFDESKSIYEWIELIQNGSMLGFQLMVYKNLFSARVDNPNRDESFNIKWSEIINRDSLEPEISGEYYASFTTINYLKDYTENESLTIVDTSQQLTVLDVYKYEKEYINNSFLINENDVIQKGKILLENFTQIRPLIRNIELEDTKWDNIQLFSTGWIDFSMDLPRQMKAIQIYMKRRKFFDRIRVKVIKIKKNLKQNKIFIDVIQCDPLESLV